MRNYLLACWIPPEAVALYLQSGLLPWIIQDTFWFYLNLLETLCTAQWEVESTTWKDGCVDQMVQYHSLELSQIRQTAADYWMHLLETCVHLCNTHKDKFQDPSFTRALLHSFTKGRAEDELPEPDPTGTKAAPKDNPRCKHCWRQGLHSGTTKDDCPLKGLSASKAQSAVANLDKKQAKSVMKTLKDQFAANPSGCTDSMIASAWSAV